MEKVFAPDDISPDVERTTAELRRVLHYWWAWAVLQDRTTGKVADLGCGSGYGGRILVETPLEVVGFDRSPVCKRLAEEKYAHPRLEIRLYDLENGCQGLPDAPYDHVVAFDVLEHLQHRELFLDLLARATAVTGSLFLSTRLADPDGENRARCTTTALVDESFQPVRCVAYGPDDLRRLLGYFFKKVYTMRDAGFPQRKFILALREERQLATLGEDLFYCTEPNTPGAPWQATKNAKSK